MSESARALLASDLAHRYTLPAEFSGFEDIGNAYRGTRYADEIERFGERLAARIFTAAHASLKPVSGHIAGFLLLQAACRRGDRILVIDEPHGGYNGYLPGYVPEYLGLEVEFLPFDEASWNLDAKASADMILERRPRLVLVGASFILFPYPLRWLRGACDDVGAVLGYDASHVLGLMAGGEFQRPMVEGVDVLSASTHKSFPGPQGGLFLANRGDIFERAMRTITWRLQDNAHWNRIAATVQVLLEMDAFGPAYAKQVIANSKALGAQLDRWGFPVRFSRRGYSESHQLHIDPQGLKERFGLSPREFADRLEANDLIVDAVGRLGTNEVTRLGAKEEHMQTIAGLVVRAARGEDVRDEVAELRSLLKLAYVFPP